MVILAGIIESGARIDLSPQGKGIGVHGFFSFWLEFFYQIDAVIAAANTDTGFVHSEYFSRAKGMWFAVQYFSLDHFYSFLIKEGECGRPWCEGSDFSVDFDRTFCPVDSAVLLFQQRSKSGLRVVLFGVWGGVDLFDCFLVLRFHFRRLRYTVGTPDQFY